MKLGMREITSINCDKTEVARLAADAVKKAIEDGHTDIEINLELDLPDKEVANIWLWNTAREAGAK